MTFSKRPFAHLSEGGAGSGDHGHAGRPGSVGGSGLSSNKNSMGVTVSAKALDIATHNPDGFTVHVVTGDVPTDGYAVAGLGREAQIPIGDKLTAQDVTAFIKPNMDLLAKPKYYLGGWAEGKTLYLDVTEPMRHSMNTALAIAHARNEIAIFGFKEGKSFYTMKDHERPDGRKRDNPLGEAQKPAPTDDKKRERIYFVFGKDQSPQAIADTINKAMGLDD